MTDPAWIDAALTASVVRTLEETGLSVSNVNCNCSFGYWKDAPPEPYFEPSLISPKPRHRADRTAMILTALDFARAVGARNVSITSGLVHCGMVSASVRKRVSLSAIAARRRASAASCSRLVSRSRSRAIE